MNGILIVDKPPDWTSQDVCAKLRGACSTRRIGHGGTLDPMATGVLPVFVGRATRAAEFSENAVKKYRAGVKPGITTDTQDTTGNNLTETSANVTKEDILRVIPNFIGEIEQIPPMYSAIKIGGKKLYELARKGVEVERKARKITIYDISVGDDLSLTVTCSKGTYIRTLVSDIGASLGCGAAMSSLRRLAAGDFDISEAHPLSDILADPAGYLLPTDSIFKAYPALSISGKALKRALNGNPFEAEIRDGKCRVYGESGDFLLLGSAENGTVTTIKSFFEV